MLRTAIKWTFSLGVGALFVWLSARDGRFDTLIELGVRFEWPYLLGGNTPHPHGHATPPSSSLVAAVASRPGWIFDLRYVALYFVVLVAIHGLRVLRWSPLLRPFGHVPLSVLNRVGAVGFMCVFLFPLRLGELVRPYLLNRERPDLPMTTLLATIVVERLVDGLVVSLMLFFVLSSLPQGDAAGDLQVAAYTALAIFLGALSFLAALFWQRERTIRLIGAIIGRFSAPIRSRVLRLVDTFIEGLSVLPHAPAFASFTLLTLVYWLLNGVGLWLFARGFALDVPLELAYAMMSCVVVGMMIPNSPGNVGSFWYFLLLPLSLYSIGPEVPQVTVYGLAVYALQLGQQTIFGLWFLATGKVRASELVEASHASSELSA